MLNLIYTPTIDTPATGMSFDTSNMCFSSPTDMTLKKLNAAIIGPNHLFPFDFLGTQSSRASAPPSRDKITPCPMESHPVHHPSLRAPRGLPEISQRSPRAFFTLFRRLFPHTVGWYNEAMRQIFLREIVYFSRKLTTCTQGWRFNRISEITN